MKKGVCLIAGANSEIGVAIARSFAADYKLILCWHRNNANLLKSKIEADYRQVDLLREEAVEGLIKSVFLEYGHIDVLINCVGKNIPHAVNHISGQDWDDVVSSNLKTAFFLCKYYWEYADKISPGSIIQLSSTAGLRPLPSSPAYIAAKAGLIALSGYFAKQMAPAIRVNTIAPGFVMTEKHASPAYDGIRQMIPLKRMASLEEVAETARYIANCEYITGQTIVLDGGLTG